jgi:hypothetical protein
MQKKNKIEERPRSGRRRFKKDKEGHNAESGIRSEAEFRIHFLAAGMYHIGANRGRASHWMIVGIRCSISEKTPQMSADVAGRRHRDGGFEQSGKCLGTDDKHRVQQWWAQWQSWWWELSRWLIATSNTRENCESGRTFTAGQSETQKSSTAGFAHCEFSSYSYGFGFRNAGGDLTESTVWILTKLWRQDLNSESPWIGTSITKTSTKSDCIQRREPEAGVFSFRQPSP